MYNYANYYFCNSNRGKDVESPLKRIICLLITLFLAVLPLSGCFLLPEEETPPVLAVLDEETAETYQYSYVTRGDLEQWASITCQFQSLQQEALTFQYDGRTIGAVYVAVGDEVEPGQLLAELENAELDAELEAAETKLADLTQELESARSNLAIVESSSDLAWQTEQYRTNVIRLEEDYAIAESRTIELREQKQSECIYAGIEGTVSYIRSYNVSDPENDYVIISDRGDACFYADTEHYASMPAGMEVTLSTDEGDVTCVVTEASDLGFPEPTVSERGTSRVYFVPTTELAMMTDSSKAKLELLLDSRRDVLIVQARALFFAGGQAYAYYENENGVREAKPVEVGLKVTGKYEVLSGLTEGEELVVG